MTTQHLSPNRRPSRRRNLGLLAAAIAAGLMLTAAGSAFAGDRFSIGFSYSSGGHYSRHYNSRYYDRHHRGYYRPFSYNRCSPFGYSYYRPHYYRTYPRYSGVNLNYNVITYRGYDDNTARIIVPPQSTVYSTTTAVPVATTTTTYTAPAAPPTPVVYKYAYEADGWALYRNNRAREAVDIFANQAEQSPNAGLPKIGYALSQATIGNDDKAAWAMRRALQYDAGALDRVPQDVTTQQSIDQLLNKYVARAEGFSRADDPFMIASLRYIARDYAGARDAAAEAAKLNPDDTALRTLQAMIDQRLAAPTSSITTPTTLTAAPATTASGYVYPYQTR
ncbi:hypothetical protein HED60_14820 [Planctomycetales bacterium ZRK34]|nr:hypothetical protein HED60_14820 [Planctomycetales bacterium ZRK34]